MTVGTGRPFGIRQIIITDLNGENPITLPLARTLRFNERIHNESFFAEGVHVGERAFSEGGQWELEAGGISFAAYAKLTGRSAIFGGFHPNETMTLTGMAGADFPYVRIYGKSVGDVGDDIHVKIFKAKVTSLSGDFRDSQFYITRCTGVAVKDGVNGLYQFVQHETAIAL